MTHFEALKSEAVERYLLDEMSDAEERAFEQHYADCPICFRSLRSGIVVMKMLLQLSNGNINN